MFADVSRGISMGQIAVGVGAEEEDDEEGVSLGELTANDIRAWGCVEFGHVCAGRGMHFLADPTISVSDQSVMTMEEGRQLVATFNKKKENESNPIVLWQIGSPYDLGTKDGGAVISSFYGESLKMNYLVAMRKQFLQEEGVAPKRAREYACEIQRQQNDRRWGSPLFYAEY